MRRAKGESRVPEPPPAPVDVRSVRAEVRDVPVTVEVTETFVADESSDVAPQTKGQIAATAVDIGDVVRKGQKED